MELSLIWIFTFEDMSVNNDKFDSLLVRLEPVYVNSENRYKQLRQKMVKFFAWKRCRDPESLADETITRLLKNVQMGQEIFATNPYSYVYSIAQNVYREHLREIARLEVVIDDGDIASSPSTEEIRDCRIQCLQGLSGDQLEMLKRYYMSGESSEEVARARNMSLNALRIYIHRVKCNLKDCHNNCVKRSATFTN
jgi:DNA-directed RNA polymerase specialized sigma24 family protein